MKTRHAIGFLILLLFTLCLLLNGGCSQNKSKESVEFPVRLADGTQVIVKYESEVVQNLFLYYTQTKQIEHVTPFSSTCVGDIEGYPDPNSVEAFGKGIIDGIKTF